MVIVNSFVLITIEFNNYKLVSYSTHKVGADVFFGFIP